MSCLCRASVPPPAGLPNRPGCPTCASPPSARVRTPRGHGEAVPGQPSSPSPHDGVDVSEGKEACSRWCHAGADGMRRPSPPPPPAKGSRPALESSRAVVPIPRSAGAQAFHSPAFRIGRPGASRPLRGLPNRYPSLHVLLLPRQAQPPLPNAQSLHGRFRSYAKRLASLLTLVLYATRSTVSPSWTPKPVAQPSPCEALAFRLHLPYEPRRARRSGRPPCGRACDPPPGGRGEQDVFVLRVERSGGGLAQEARRLSSLHGARRSVVSA